MEWCKKKTPKNYLAFEKKYGKTKALSLINANITTLKDANDYFNDTKLHNPSLIPGLKESIDIIWESIHNKKKICVFGDYDVDGITASVILKLAIKKAGGETKVRLPDRLTEGFGITKKAIDEMLTNGIDLFITVDNGIKSIEEIGYAKARGASVIILDHHIPDMELPDADSISDLHWNNGMYPFKNLTGSGLAFKAACLLLEKIDPEFAMSLIDLAAIGTIADVEVLLGENRVIVKKGIELMRSHEYNRTGIKALFTGEISHVTAEDIAFQISPCLNACGRLKIKGAELSYELLISDDIETSINLAEKIRNINSERKKIQKLCFDKLQIEAQKCVKRGDKIIVLFCEHSLPGIVGLLAGDLKEKFNRPAVVFGEKKDINGNVIWSGSARSISEYNILEGLDICRKYLIKYGGHALAAGMSIEASSIALKNLKRELNKTAHSLPYSVLTPKIYWVCEINTEELKKGHIYKELDECEPFGQGNPKPIFKVVFDTLASKNSLYETIGNEKKHLKLFADGFSALGFNMADRYENMGKPKKIEALCSLRENYYKGNEYKQILLKDFKEVKIKESDLMKQLSNMLSF